VQSQEKTPLQVRAELAVSKFRSRARRPVVIEFSGVPKAGKTSTISQVHGFLKRCGFKTETVIERASICPVRDKRHFNFNVWTACTTLAQLIEKTQDPPKEGDPEILLLDRGLFDSLAWLSMMERMERIRKHERKVVEDFLLQDDWRKRIGGVVLMTASPKDAMSREQGNLPVVGSGSIMNEQVIQQMLDNTLGCAKRFEGKFHIHRVDTSAPGSNPKQTVEDVAEIVVGIIEGELEEEILSLDRASVTGIFNSAKALDATKAAKLVEQYVFDGQFTSREIVEKDLDRVQALPVVVIRNKSGQVLQLRRKESDAKNPLHDKLVIWAGGHVRKEDSANGHTILQGAVRELQEELRLRVDAADLKLLGAVFTDSGGGLSKHLAVVYEWQSQSDEVNLVLNAAEFIERKGPAQSGKFIGIADLKRCVESDQVVEQWSVHIVNDLLPNSAFVEAQGALF
jgi:predicted NUDIX family phosphoesterase